MKMRGWMAMVGGAAVAVSVQAAETAVPTHVLDQAVATELMRNVGSQLAVGALQNNAEFARAYTTSVLEQELAQESARRGLTERLDVQRALSVARFQVLIQALQGDIARGVTQPTDAEIKDKFEKNRKDYKLLEAVKVDLYAIDGTSSNALDVVRSAVAAQKIDPAKLQTVPFKEIGTAAQVWVAKDIFRDEVWKAVREMKKDQVQFFRVEGNYWLLRYEDYRAERPATLDEAKDGIRNQMVGERQQKAWADFVQKTAKKIGLAN